jgi:hypothetical protein
MIFIPASEKLPAVWINPANINIIYQYGDYMIIVFCDKSRLTISKESMAIVLSALKESQITYEPIPNLNELID